MSNSNDSSKRGWEVYLFTGAGIALLSLVLFIGVKVLEQKEKTGLDRIIEETGFKGCSSDCEPRAFDWEAEQAKERQQLAIANKKAVTERKAKEEQQRLIAIQLEKDRKAEEERKAKLEKAKKEREAYKEKQKMIASRGTNYQGSWHTTQATHYSLGNTGGDIPACGVINLQQTGTHYQGMRIIAANTNLYPCGSILEIKSKLGTEKAIVMDTGGFLKSKPRNIDILVRTEKEAYALGRYNIEFRVLRKGW